MYFCYIDDSGDEKVRVFSVVAIPLAAWRVCFERRRDFRRKLKRDRGIFVTVEFHATELVSGRGRISEKTIGKYERSQVFKETLQEITQLPGARLFNAIGPKDKEAMLYERLLNRINRTLVSWQSPGLLISDEGKDYTSLVRRMGVHNPIPSMYGGWPGGRLRTSYLVRSMKILSSENLIGPTSFRWPTSAPIHCCAANTNWLPRTDMGCTKRLTSLLRSAPQNAFGRIGEN